MEKQFLVTGAPSRLTIDMAHECLSKKQQVLLTLEPGADAPPIPAGLEDRLQYMEWNRRSPISARFVLLQAVNKQIQIDHAIMVYTPGMDRTVLHEANAAYFEEKMDFEIKGYLFMVKELISHFIKQGKGSITFLVQNPGPDILPPLDHLTLKAVEGLTESILSYYSQENLVLRAVFSRQTQNRQLTEAVMNLVLEDNPKTRNKITRLGAKPGLFNFGGKG